MRPALGAEATFALNDLDIGDAHASIRLNDDDVGQLRGGRGELA